MRGDPPDPRHAGLVERGLGVLDELVRQPVLVLLVVQALGDLGVVGVLAGEDVLDPHELHVDATLGLGAQDLDRAGHDDDEPVAGVDRLGDHAGEVGGLAALDVADDQALRRLDLRAGRVRQPLHDRAGALVERGDGGCGPLLHLGEVASRSRPNSSVLRL